MNQAIHNEISQELSSKFGDKLLKTSQEYDFIVLEVAPENIIEILTFLKNESIQKLDFLTTMCGLHYPEQIGKELGVMYQLKNLITNYSIRIKSYFPISNPKISSIVSLFPSANWMERQEFDFFGIDFIGHPDLRRILNMDEMNYHPMRKEYRLEDGTRDDKEDKFFGR